MTTTIAIAGKGGTGKTTIAALLIKLLSEKGVVLAVDADPATNLNQCLGLPLDNTVGGIREQITEDVQKGRVAVGVAKQDLLDSKLMESLVESKGLDLLAMGRPEGPGCYCASNHMLRISLDRLGRNYDYIIMDCEAGMEHISRQTTRDVDFLLVTSDPTIRGITVAGGIKKLIGELRTQTRMLQIWRQEGHQSQNSLQIPLLK
jgi:CO dehydrogenase maturation factor